MSVISVLIYEVEVKLVKLKEVPIVQLSNFSFFDILFPFENSAAVRIYCEACRRSKRTKNF